MAKVLHSVYSFDSFIEKDFTGQSEVWLQWKQALNQSALDDFFQGHVFLYTSGGFGQVVDTAMVDSTTDPRFTTWNATNGPFGPVLQPLRYYTIGLHATISGGVLTTEFVVDGVTLGPVNNGGVTVPGLITGIIVGGFFFGTGGDEVWVDDITVGTSGFGSSNLFAANFSSGVFVPPFTSDADAGDGGLMEIIDDPDFYTSPGAGRVLIAWNDNPLEPSPTWTRMDDPDIYPNLIAGIDIHRGKQTERDRTDTGTATVYVNDTEGIFDYYNTGNAWVGDIDGKQIVLQAWNPVDLEWVPQFRGFINDYSYDIAPSQVVANVQIECVDLFDYLGGYGVQPGVNGDTPPAGSAGTVFYEDTAGTVDDRIIQVLTEVGIDSTMQVVFTGNVSLQETKYDPGDAILNVLRDCADAEMPDIANIYIDKIGRFVFHGRYARFDPDATAAGASPGAWNFMRWKVGDRAAIIADSDTAQMRVLSYGRGKTDIINSAMSYPRHEVIASEEAKIPGQLFEDATSIATYGKHSWEANDLIIQAGTTTGNDKWEECAKFAEFKVANQKAPGIRIKTLTLKPLPAHDPRAAATWGVITGADISDIVNARVLYPGANPNPAVASGIDYEDFYIEGVTMRIRPLNSTFDNVEVDLDVSPAEWSMDTHGVFA